MNAQVLSPTVADEINTVATHWVDSYGDYLFNFAVSRVRDTHVAEDLVQDTFLAALKSQACFSGRSSARTWLVGILRHKIYDYLRQIRHERAVRVEPLPADDGDGLNEPLLWLHQVIDETLSFSRRLELGEFRQQLQKALGNLPAHIAQAFQLYYVEERSNREVCQQLNISESNLWVMLYRARRQLRADLAAVV
jgi:RNA polymerase sigma-70 factor (ECF subfamily)